MIAQQPAPTFTSRLTGVPFMRTATIVVFWVALSLVQSARGDVWISEFLADNQNGLRTKTGNAADWIELANNGPEAVDLSGWYLTDRATALTKWRIPDGTTIPTKGYVVIFADSS